MIGFDKTNLENNNHLDRMVHFFLYDYKFERVWKNPDTDLEQLRRYRAVLTPDFSMYLEMAPVMQLYHTFRNRWCGAYWASKGIRVIPTVSWGDENSFDFCFEGIEKGGTVAVSTFMVSEHGSRAGQKEFFLKGYNELLKCVEPERIICYHRPFPEMQGNIIFVDYDRSSWRYINDDLQTPSKYAEYICGTLPLPLNSGIVIKQGYVISQRVNRKGMGSAYGGPWKPKNADAERYLGEPGETKTTYDKNGDRRDTKIGSDGRAEQERHYTDHNRPDKHTDPHDHIIGWDKDRGSPLPGPPINYPNGAPEFKCYGGIIPMKNKQLIHNIEEEHFESISDFKWCVDDGGEVEFDWDGVGYTITHPEGRINISEFFKPETEMWCDTADEVLEYKIGDTRLRDIITKVNVRNRTL